MEFTVQEAADSSVLLSWGAVPGASLYLLTWGLSSGNVWCGKETLIHLLNSSGSWLAGEPWGVSMGSFISFWGEKKGKWELEEAPKMSHLAIAKSLGEEKKGGVGIAQEKGILALSVSLPVHQIHQKKADFCHP